MVAQPGGTDVTGWSPERNTAPPLLCAITVEVTYDPAIRMPPRADADPDPVGPLTGRSTELRSHKVRFSAISAMGVSSASILADIT
jgi:hypothetical protein